MPAIRDLAAIRLDNALLLFDEFVRVAAARPDAATLRGLERRFAERLQIQPSYWSQIKGRSRQIGERLARQFEQLCRKPQGWMDVPHAAADAGAERPPDAGSQPLDEDERFIVGLVLMYYRRHPQRARARLLDLLGEVLVPAGDGAAAAAAAPDARAGERAAAAAPAAAADEGSSLWAQATTRVAPLGRRR